MATPAWLRQYETPVARPQTPEERKASGEIRRTEAGASTAEAEAPYAGETASERLKNIKDERAMRLVNQFESNPTYKRYDSAVGGIGDALRVGGDPMGDIALTYAAAKVFDPDSAVRDAEQAAMGNTTNFLERTVARIKKEFGLPEGGTFSPQARQALRREVYTKGVVLSQSYDRLRRDYATRAKKVGIDPEFVIGSHLSEPIRPDIERFEQTLRGRRSEAAPKAGATALEQRIPGADYVAPPQVSDAYGGGKPMSIPQEAQDEAIAYIQSQGKNLTEKSATEGLTAIFKKHGIDAVPTPDSISAVVASVQRGGGFGGINPELRKLTAGEQVADYLLKNPVSGLLGGIASGTTAGLLPEAVGLFSPEKQAAMEQSIRETRDVNPAYNLGEMVGGAYGAGKVGAAVKPLLKIAGAGEAAAPIIGDVLFGGTQGAAEAEPGSRLQGAATNIGLTVAGHALPAAFSRTLSPQTSEAVDFLRQKGVTLTPGQTLGGRAARLEEIGSKMLLGGGDIAIAARRKAFDDFNRQYLNEAGSHIGFNLPDVKMKPTERMKKIGEAFDNAYDNARSQMNFVPDQDYVLALDDFQKSLGTDLYSEDNARRLRNLFDNEVIRRSFSGAVSGDDYKKLTSLLGKRYRTFAKTDPELANGVLELQKIVDGAAIRNSTPEAVDYMNNVDKGFAFLARAQEAGRMAGSRPGEFTPAQLMSVERRGDITNRGRAFNEGDTLAQKWAESGQEVLGNVEPDSGTATRLAMAGPATGFTAVDPTGIGYVANALLGLSNVPGIKQGLTAAFSGRRPMPIDWLGTKMQEYASPIARGTSATMREIALAKAEEERKRQENFGVTDDTQAALNFYTNQGR